MVGRGDSRWLVTANLGKQVREEGRVAGLEETGRKAVKGREPGVSLAERELSSGGEGLGLATREGARASLLDQLEPDWGEEEVRGVDERRGVYVGVEEDEERRPGAFRAGDARREAAAAAARREGGHSQRAHTGRQSQTAKGARAGRARDTLPFDARAPAGKR